MMKRMTPRGRRFVLLIRQSWPIQSDAIQRRRIQSLSVINTIAIVITATHTSRGGDQSQRPRIPDITPHGPAITANTASNVPPTFDLSAAGNWPRTV
jgi:hypothetical protein